jgi:small subunit ribosomal protein S1
VLVLDKDLEARRISFSTRVLEVEPGDMLQDPQRVYATAEEMAAKFREQRTDRRQQKRRTY